MQWDSLEAGPTVGFLSPGASSALPAAGLADVSLGGNCSEDGEQVRLSGDLAAEVLCTGNLWQVSADFSAAPEGPLLIFADHASADGVQASQSALVLVKDTLPPTAAVFSLPTVVAPATVARSFVSDPAFTWSATDSGSGIASSNGYEVRLFADPACAAGQEVATASVSEPSYVASGLVNGQSYTIKVTAYDQAGNSVGSGCSPPMLIDTGMPTLAGLDDPDAPATGITNELVVLATVGGDVGTARWCLSDAQISMPASSSEPCGAGAGLPNLGWSLTQPSDLALTGADGVKTVRLWVADTAGRVKAGQTQSIFLDTTAPTVPAGLGIKGGAADITADAFLVSSVAASPAVWWSLSADAGTGVAGYAVTIYADGGAGGPGAVQCATQDLLGSNVGFGCTLAVGASYYAGVRARDPAGNVSSEALLPFATRAPASLSFTVPAAASIGGGGVPFPTTAAFTVEVKNIGGMPATGVTIPPGSLANANFRVLGHDCGTTIGVSADTVDCRVQMQFVSPGLGAQAGAVNVGFHDALAAQSVAFGVDAVGSPHATTVSARYPSASGWTFQATRSDPSSPVHLQPDAVVACNANTHYKTCFHAGELRMFAGPAGLSSCSGLVVADSLGAFDWVCDSTVSPVRFLSTGLASQKGLADLVTAAAWRDNLVTVTGADGLVKIKSPLANWWAGQAVQALPDSSAARMVLSVPGVYTLSSSQLSHGYLIDGSHIAVVTLPGSTLSMAPAAAINCASDPFSGIIDAKALICSHSGYVATWLEGSFSGNGVAHHGAVFRAASQVILHRATFYSAGLAGLKSIASSSMRILHSKFKSNGGHGASFHGSVGALIDDSAAYQNTGAGFSLDSSEQFHVQDSSGDRNGQDGIAFESLGRILLHRFRAANNDRAGIYANGIWWNSTEPFAIVQANVSNNGAGVTISGSAGVRLVGSTVSGSQSSGVAGAHGDGIRIDGSINTIVHQVTSAHNSSHGIAILGGSSATTLSNVVASGNAIGIERDGTSSVTRVAGAVVTDNSLAGVKLDGLASGAFARYLKVAGNNPGNDCVLVGGTPSEGLVDGVCVGTGLDAQSSGAGGDLLTLRKPASLAANAFVGQLAASDSANASDNAGLTPLSQNITDWVGFDNFFRAWGLDGAALGDATAVGRCAFGDMCRVWDWRVLSTNVSLLWASTESGESAPVAWANGGPCPAQVDPDRTVLPANPDASVGGKRFLANAAEIPGQGSGNGDGLCTSGETCVFGPNAGSYQGEGDYATRGCVPAFSAATDVVVPAALYEYPFNGVSPVSGSAVAAP